jgi:hypothetical protein
MTIKNTKRHSSSIMNGEIATFRLESFDEFVTSYKASIDFLASEAVEAFNQFLPALDRFFDLCEELTEYNYMNDDDISIKWYKSAEISSGDTIRAVSNWYHQVLFDNISVNMNSDENEDYTTYDGTCFGKVILLILIIKESRIIIVVIVYSNCFDV